MFQVDRNPIDSALRQCLLNVLCRIRVPAPESDDKTSVTIDQAQWGVASIPVSVDSIEATERIPL